MGQKTRKIQENDFDNARNKNDQKKGWNIVDTISQKM